MRTDTVHDLSVSFTGTDPEKCLCLCAQKCIKVSTASWFKEKLQGIFIKRKQKKQIMFTEQDMKKQ